MAVNTFITGFVPTAFAYCLLVFSMLSMWWGKLKPVWILFFSSSLFFAIVSRMISIQALIPIAVLFLSYLLLSLNLVNFGRMLVGIICTAVSMALIWHLFVGFDNFYLLKAVVISPNGAAVNFNLPYDIPFVGLFSLAFYSKLITKREDWQEMLGKALVLSVFAILILLGVFLSFNLGEYNLKSQPLLIFWYLLALVLVIIPEEAFYRGYLQKEITSRLDNSLSPFLAIIVVAFLFATTRVWIAPSSSYFFFLMIESILYGAIFHLTGFLESAIIARFLFLGVHLFFFTYPTFIGKH
jgi:uncharacterized protein